MQFPEPIRIALSEGKEFFWGEDGSEWSLAVEESAARTITSICGHPVLVFANNGYGDYLFLKLENNATCGTKVSAYYHEGSQIEAWDVSLVELLGQVQGKPSLDSYPPAVYRSGQLVQLGDKVRLRSWIFFWRGWMEGTVQYVPGQSPKKQEHEHSGLKWVHIVGSRMTASVLVEPKTGVIKGVQVL